MSNRKLVEILNQGVSVWNNWRSENYVQEPDFSGKDFSGCDFTGADLSGAIFDDCNLSNTNFTDASLHSVRFVNADINGANFTRAELNKAVLSDSINRDNADFTGATF